MPITPSAPPIITLNFAPPTSTTSHCKQESQSLNLRPYQIVRATVLEGGMNTVELELGRLRLNAQTQIPLKGGQKLHLLVQNTSPNIELKILNEALLENIFQRIQYIGKEFDLASFLSQIRSNDESAVSIESFFSSSNLLSLFSKLTKNQDQITGKFLSSLSRLLGLKTEALLAEGQVEENFTNLKTSLMKIVLQEDGNPTLQTKSKALIQHLELFQLCQVKLYQDNILFLPLPFSFLQQGFALLEKQSGESGGKEQESCRVSIHLQLKTLGNLEIRLLYQDSKIFIRILCQNQEIVDIMKKAKEEFKSTVTTIKIENLTIGLGAQDPEKVLTEKIVPDSDHFFEAKV